jgi:hypothetical protein
MTGRRRAPLTPSGPGDEPALADSRGGRPTADAGASTRRRVEARPGPSDAPDAAVPDPRRPGSIEPDPEAVPARRIAALAPGSGDLDGHHPLRGDPALRPAAGGDPGPDSPPASPATSRRPGGRVGRGAATGIAAAPAEQPIAGHAEPPGPPAPDFDATDGPARGEREGRPSRGDYDHHRSRPPSVFRGDEIPAA